MTTDGEGLVVSVPAEGERLCMEDINDPRDRFILGAGELPILKLLMLDASSNPIKDNVNYKKILRLKMRYTSKI